MSSNRPEISIVVLCYKSHKFAEIFYKRVKTVLEKNKLNYEIILVGNFRPASYDITPNVITNIAVKDNKVKAIIRPKLKSTDNMGWDMRMGLALSKGGVVGVIDGDGQMIPGDIPKLYFKLVNEGLDLCKSKRVVREDGLYRIIVSFFFNLTMKIMFPGIRSDINGKPKLFTRKTLNLLKLSSDDWFIDAEIMIKARKLKLKIGEIKTSFRKNPERKSFIAFRENFEFIKNIFKWRIIEFKNN